MANSKKNDKKSDKKTTIRVPDGYYRAKPVQVTTDEGEVTYAQLGVTARKRTPQVLIMLQIEGGEFNGARLPWFGYFSDDAKKRTVESLKMLGFAGKSIRDLPAAELTNSVPVTVGNNEFEGKTMSRVDWIGAGPGIQIDGMSGNQLDDLASDVDDLF